MQAAAQNANDTVLLHPEPRPTSSHQPNRMVDDVALLRGKLGLGGDDSSIDARRWVAAAADLRETAFERGTDQLDAVRRFGDTAGNRVRGTARSLRDATLRREARQLPRGDTEQSD